MAPTDDYAPSSCFGNLFSFKKKQQLTRNNRSVAAPARTQPAPSYYPATSEKLPAYDECVSKVFI